MLNFNNNHIFTGYLKQLLTSTNIPTCKIYTQEFAKYFAEHGVEDPRLIESFDTINYCVDEAKKVYKKRIATRVNYIKNNELFNYFLEDPTDTKINQAAWRPGSNVFFEANKKILGLTRSLHSINNVYDTATHEFLGDYLRFLRDYHGINLMSLYNCFNDKLYGNIFCRILADTKAEQQDQENKITKLNSDIFVDSLDTRYKIYAFPVKLFAEYTIAIDSSEGIEVFCGFYKNNLDLSNKGVDLIKKTYKKYNKTLFNQPFLYDKLNVINWNLRNDRLKDSNNIMKFLNDKSITRWDIANREQDLKLFLKVPISSKSSITVLEGDFRHFNDCIFTAQLATNGNQIWKYQQNHCIINFEVDDKNANLKDKLKNDLNGNYFKPIGKLQLLAYNSGQSYPFSDRLIEYLSNSVITPIDEIPDNIKRAQKVMNEHGHYFKIDGIWENKMQKIIYDYVINAGPFEAIETSDEITSKAEYNIKLNDKTNLCLKRKNSSKPERIVIDKRKGTNPRLGHYKKSFLFDILGYIDKDAEKWYASWVQENNKAVVKESIQNVDIYNGLYDI